MLVGDSWILLTAGDGVFLCLLMVIGVDKWTGSMDGWY